MLAAQRDNNSICKLNIYYIIYIQDLYEPSTVLLTCPILSIH